MKIKFNEKNMKCTMLNYMNCKCKGAVSTVKGPCGLVDRMVATDQTPESRCLSSFPSLVKRGGRNKNQPSAQKQLFRVKLSHNNFPINFFITFSFVWVNDVIINQL